MSSPEPSPESRFNEAYRTGAAPWDIGRPQPEVEAVAERLSEALARARGRGGGLSLLDAGCGTGENALLFARLGLEVWGVDTAPLAVERAEAKARQRGLAATFRLADALELERLGRTFDHVLDCGLLHVFDDADRARYVRSVAAVLRPGGQLHVLCMRDVGIDFGFGPRRLREDELRAAFAEGWRIEELRPAAFASSEGMPFGSAWFLTARRL